MRDDKWLFLKLDEVWDHNFPDVPQENDVKIVWGRRARSRLGSIKLGQKRADRQDTIITINGLFRDERIPDCVVTATIAHELSHYAHGFNSALNQRYATPHAGGVVTRELRKRGLEKIFRDQKKWLKDNWKEYLEIHFPRKARLKKKRRIVIRWK